MLAPEFVQAEIKEWLKDQPEVPVKKDFYPLLAKKIVEALKLYEKSVLDYNGPKFLDDVLHDVKNQKSINVDV